MDEATGMLVEIRERLVRVETKIDSQSDIRSTAETAEKTAIKALESAQSAHHRLNRVDRLIFWAGTTIIGGLVIAGITFMVKGGLNN